MIEILKIVLPALLVLLTAYLLIDKLMRNEEQRRNFEIRKKNKYLTSEFSKFSQSTPRHLCDY